MTFELCTEPVEIDIVETRKQVVILRQEISSWECKSGCTTQGHKEVSEHLDA